MPLFPGRRYIGLSTTGVRFTTAEIRVTEILMAAGQLLLDRSGAGADPYLALVGYFSATRELAGMARYMGVAVAVPSCRYELWPRTPGRNPGHGVAWLGDPLSGSWVSVIPGDTKDRYEVRQHGPRRLWNEVEVAYRWWLEQGNPTLDQWRFTVSPDRQTADLQ